MTIEYSAGPLRARTVGRRIGRAEVPTPLLRAIRRELASGSPAPWARKYLESPSFKAKLEREAASYGRTAVASPAETENATALARARIANARLDAIALRLRRRIDDLKG
jgi:hypothetical protein